MRKICPWCQERVAIKYLKRVDGGTFCPRCENPVRVTDEAQWWMLLGFPLLLALVGAAAIPGFPVLARQLWVVMYMLFVAGALLFILRTRLVRP